jgi:hypothetical protein
MADSMRDLFPDNQSVDKQKLRQSLLMHVSTISELKSIGPGESPVVLVLGYNTPGDGGGGFFFWDPVSSLTENGGSVISPSPAVAVGRWRRV